MKKMADKEFNLNKMFMVFIILVIGTALISVIAEQEQARTKQSSDSDTLDLSTARLGANNVNESYVYHLQYGCPGSDWRNDDSTCTTNNVVVKNSTGGALTVTTDYVVTNNNARCTGQVSGDIYFKNSTATVALLTNSTTVTYSYCPDEYVSSSWGRTVLDNVPGFFAIALLAASLVYGLYWFINRREE